jgi:hypothetical protein
VSQSNRFHLLPFTEHTHTTGYERRTV